MDDNLQQKHGCCPLRRRVEGESRSVYSFNSLTWLCETSLLPKHALPANRRRFPRCLVEIYVLGIKSCVLRTKSRFEPLKYYMDGSLTCWICCVIWFVSQPHFRFYRSCTAIFIFYSSHFLVAIITDRDDSSSSSRTTTYISPEFISLLYVKWRQQNQQQQRVTVKQPTN